MSRRFCMLFLKSVAASLLDGNADQRMFPYCQKIFVRHGTVRNKVNQEFQ
jgi:hypothetical protein